MKDIAQIRRENTKVLIEKHGLSRTEFAEKTGMAYSQLANYIGENPTKNIGRKVASRIESAFNLSENWLDQDWEQGEMTALQSNVSPNFEPISDWDDDTPLESDECAIPFYKDFGVACGHGSDGVAYENERRRLRMSRATIDRIGSYKDKVFATLADGDSMSPTINNGDTIWVDMSKETIKDGKIFVFEYGGLFICKRLYRLPNNGLRVVSDNADVYPEWEITGEEREQNGFRLIGWVWHWSVMERW